MCCARILSRSFWLAMVLGIGGHTLSAQTWTEVKSKNFTVITDAGDRRGREVAQHFEQMRLIFGSLILRDKINPTAPLAVIAFKDRNELSQVAPLWKGKPVDLAGVYYKGEDRNFIALDLSSTAGWSVVFHEYAHLLLNTNFPPSQLWFDEGFAEYFTTIEIGKSDVKIGLPLPYAGEMLAGGLMPVEKLFAITRTSPEYNETGDHRSLFYAESWLMVHYLYDMKHVKQTSKYFDLVLKQNVPIGDAIKQAYGFDAKEMDKQLRAYMVSREGVAFTLQLPSVDEDVTYSTRKMKDYEAKTVIADLHLHSTDHFEQSRGELEAILNAHPESADANRGLGYWYWKKNDLDKATEYFRTAARLGSTDGRVYLQVAQALYRKGDRDAETMYDMSQYLNKAIQYEPDLAEAYNLEGYVFSNMHDFAHAIDAIKTAVRLDPRNEHYQMNLAEQYLAADRYDDAIAIFDRLKNSSDITMASAATARGVTARQYKAEPLMRMSARQQPADTSGDDSKELASVSDKDELKAMEERQRGMGDTDESKDERAPVEKLGEESKPDKRPMKFLSGKLIGVDCSREPGAVLKLLHGEKTYKLFAASVNKLTVVGANEFSCEWKNRKVSVNYRESGPLRGDVVSIEVY